MRKKAQPEMMPVTNNKGQTMLLPANATIGDLVKMGLVGIRLEPPGSPLPDGWWRDSSKRP